MEQATMRPGLASIQSSRQMSSAVLLSRPDVGSCQQGGRHDIHISWHLPRPQTAAFSSPDKSRGGGFACLHV